MASHERILEADLAAALYESTAEIAAAHGWEQRDILDALIQAHNIKGSSGSHSLMIVSELAGVIEKALDTLDKNPGIISGGERETVSL